MISIHKSKLIVNKSLTKKKSKMGGENEKFSPLILFLYLSNQLQIKRPG